MRGDPGARSAGGRGGRGPGGGGRLDRRILTTLFGLELRLLLRDKRTLLIAVVLPLVLLPGLFLIMNAVEASGEEELERTTYRYAVTGSQGELAQRLVLDALALSPPGATGQADDDEGEEPTLIYSERRVSNPDSVLETGDLHLVVEGLTYEEYRASREAEASRDSSVEEEVDTAGPAVPVVRLLFRANSDLSRTAQRRLQERLRRLRLARRDSVLRERGLGIAPEQFASVDLNNVASAEKEGGAALGQFLTLLVMMLMMTGGSIVAADAISGEKERGTIETLLTSAARPVEVVAAKQLAIIVVGLAITVINIANLLIYVVSGLFEVPENFAVSVPPGGLAVILLLYLPLTAMVAGALLLLSGYSKTYREYQIYYFPVFLLLLIPSAAAVLPGIDLRSAIAFVPIANVSVAVREVLVGEFDWLFLVASFAVTAGAAVYVSRLTAVTLSTERLITAAELEEADIKGGPALFRRHVLRWFAMLWAIFFVAALWFGADLGIRGQVLLNVVGIFFGGSLLMAWRYRLDIREAFALRPVKLPVWIAVLIGAPSAFAAGQGVFRLANYVFPVPERMLEAFGEALLPPDLALWEVLFFLALLPGIFEEIAFRGVLLHGLRRKFHPVVLCLVVGAIFGFFHVELFRLIPTAYLGAVLAAVVVLTGSIFPAMLWHALNNAIGLVPAYAGVAEELPLWTAPVGAVGLALAFWIIWRNRSIYPDLRT